MDIQCYCGEKLQKVNDGKFQYCNKIHTFVDFDNFSCMRRISIYVTIDGKEYNYTHSVHCALTKIYVTHGNTIKLEENYIFTDNIYRADKIIASVLNLGVFL